MDSYFSIVLDLVRHYWQKVGYILKDSKNDDLRGTNPPSLYTSLRKDLKIYVFQKLIYSISNDFFIMR